MKLTQKEIRQGLDDYQKFLNGRLKKRTSLTQKVLAKFEKDTKEYEAKKQGYEK